MALLGVVALFGTSSILWAQSHVPGETTLEFKREVDQVEIQDFFREYRQQGWLNGRQPIFNPAANTFTATLEARKSIEEAVQVFQKDSRVKHAEPNLVAGAGLSRTQARWSETRNRVAESGIDFDSSKPTSQPPVTLGIGGGGGGLIPTTRSGAEQHAGNPPFLRPGNFSAQFRIPLLTSQNNRYGNAGINVGPGFIWAGRRKANGPERWVQLENSNTRRAHHRVRTEELRDGLSLLEPFSFDWESPKVGDRLSFYAGAGPTFGYNHQSLLVNKTADLWEYKCPGGIAGTSNSGSPICPDGWNGTEWITPTFGAARVVQGVDSEQTVVPGEQWSGAALSAFTGFRIALGQRVSTFIEWRRSWVNRAQDGYKLGLSFAIGGDKK